MFRVGVEEEVRVLPEVGPTADSALGLEEIRALIAVRFHVKNASRRCSKRRAATPSAVDLVSSSN